MRGRGRAGAKLSAVAARRTSLPATAMDWTGRFREMKEGWRIARFNGGRFGGRGRGFHLAEIGSKLKNWRELGEGFDGGEREEEETTAYRERKGGNEGE